MQNTKFKEHREKTLKKILENKPKYYHIPTKPKDKLDEINEKLDAINERLDNM